ncbi:MAG: hypothetical protein EOM36_04710 [Bacteroidia bacterium]|nr:hypothetical protein [Bacteroidia bacterium]
MYANDTSRILKHFDNRIQQYLSMHEENCLGSASVTVQSIHWTSIQRLMYSPQGTEPVSVNADYDRSRSARTVSDAVICTIG